MSAVASGMSIGLCIVPTPPIGLSRLLAYAARLSRLDSLWAVDHWQGLFPNILVKEEFPWALALSGSSHALFDFQVLLGYLTRSAGRVRLGVGVTDPVRRHPVLIAQAMLTLAHMTRRRPVLGIGAGERENIDPYGLDFTTPVGRLEEALQIIRSCFTHEGSIDFHGKYYQLDGAVVDLRAPQGRTPEIWIGGKGPRMLRLTGQYGDGWFPTTIASSQEYAAKLKIVRTAAQEAGRDPQAITPALIQFVVPAPSESEARAMLETDFGRILALQIPADEWRRYGAQHPFGELFRGYVDWMPEQYDRKTLKDALAAVPPELIGYGLMTGTPAQIAARLRLFGEVGVRHVGIFPISMIVSRKAAIYALWALHRIARLVN